jgi:hypothetical protein
MADHFDAREVRFNAEADLALIGYYAVGEDAVLRTMPAYGVAKSGP